ncbi:MAG: transcriptional regulator [Lewinellaceae bacterium]|nr:transcriptional regulator [Lewinellaceae bacterium]HQU52896.1 transcriptional regulator [Saprospiraceae bacterium]
MKEILRDLDKAFENKIRLALMSALVVNDYLDFNTLKELLDVTDGNLASHLRYLENQHYITFTKTFLDRKPNTRYQATDAGKIAFERHIRAIEKLLE